jgi:hypothetical protein
MKRGAEMKHAKTRILALIMALCCLAAAMPFHAAAENETYTVTKKAHVVHLSNEPVETGKRQIILYFEPFKFENKGDEASQIQAVPYYGAPILKSDGKALGTILAPGQEVKVTFTYQMRDTGMGTIDADDQEWPLREMEIVKCEKIELVGKTLLLGEHAGMKRDIFRGTVLKTAKNSLTIFAEGTPVYDGDDEYIARGQIALEVTDKTAFIGAARADIKPFTRVEIKCSDGVWMESAPPQYAGGDCESVKLLEHGDQWGSDAEQREIRVAVKEQIKTEGGLAELLCIPLDSYTRYNSPLIRLEGWFDYDLTPYTPGTVLTAPYLAVNKKANPPVYSYVNDVEVNANRRLTAQELSGVFGRPGDVAVTVTKDDISQNDERIPVLLTNKTNTEVSFGNYYQLAVKRDGQWYKYTNPQYHEEVSVTTDSQIVEPRNEREFSFWRGLHTDKLPTGTYRIVTLFSAGALGDNEPPTFDYFVYSNEFTVN